MPATVPCSTCPYRRSVPLGIWHPEEYERLRQQDGELIGTTFGCHLNDGSLCRGWLADQKRRGIPSIALRLTLIQSDEAMDALGAVDENDPDLYASIEEMCEANEGRAFPSRTRAARKLLRQKRGARP